MTHIKYVKNCTLEVRGGGKMKERGAILRKCKANNKLYSLVERRSD